LHDVPLCNPANEIAFAASWVVHHPFSVEDQAAMGAMRAIVEPFCGLNSGDGDGVSLHKVLHPAG
jgi:hypothetical protein